MQTENGDWAVTSMSPRSGPVATETLISISGEFPSAAHVWFGDEPGTIYLQTPTWILARTPLRAEPGAVEVTLRAGQGIVLTIPDGYAYLAEGQQPPTVVDPGPGPTPTNPPAVTTPTTSPDTSDPDDGEIIGPDPGTGVDPGQPPTTTTDGDDDGSDDEGTGGGDDDDESESDGGKSRNRQARAVPTGDKVELGGGLIGRRLDGLSEVGDVPRCKSDPCRTRRIAT